VNPTFKKTSSVFEEKLQTKIKIEKDFTEEDKFLYIIFS
jgi:hypothetical protein